MGPDDPSITDAVVHIDEMLGRLIAGLEARGMFEDVNIILVGDHGMVGTCDRKLARRVGSMDRVEVRLGSVNDAIAGNQAARWCVAS